MAPPCRKRQRNGERDLRIRCGRNLAPTLLFGNPIHALFENMVRTKSRGAILLGNFSAHHENTVRTNSRRVQKTQKRRKGRLLSRPFRPLPLIRGSGLPNVTCKVQAPLQDAPFYILHFTFYTLPARWWAFAAPTAILSLYLCSVPFIVLSQLKVDYAYCWSQPV